MKIRLTRRKVAGLLLVVAMVGGGCASTELASTDPEQPVASTAPQAARSGPRACAPACSSGFADPGAIPAGNYRTKYFLDGFLTVTFPSTWESHEDQGVEFSAGPAGNDDEQTVLFWLDIEPVHNQQRVSGVPSTLAGWSKWLTSNPDLAVRRAGSGRIGSIPATAFDISVADKADVKPECEGHKCIDILTWPGSDAFYGIGDSFWDPLRLYLADVEYDGAPHVLAVAVHAQHQMKKFLPIATKLVESARLEGVGPR